MAQSKERKSWKRAGGQCRWGALRRRCEWHARRTNEQEAKRTGNLDVYMGRWCAKPRDELYGSKANRNVEASRWLAFVKAQLTNIYIIFYYIYIYVL